MLFNQFFQRALGVAQRLGHVHVYLAGAVPRVELRNMLKRFCSFRKSGVEWVHNLSAYSRPPLQ